MSDKKQFSRDLKFIVELILINLMILIPFIVIKDSLYVITSPSMSPTINVGDIVVMGNKNPDEIKVSERNGDILVIKGPQYYYDEGFDPLFWNNLSKDTPIIHRAIDKKKIDDKWYFLTKGDNNLVADGGYKFVNFSEDYILIEYNKSEAIYLCETEILGVVIYVIPFIGYFKIYFPLIFTFIIGFLLIYIAFKHKGIKIKLIKS